MVLFTETRENSIRRFDGLPHTWIDRPAADRAVLHAHAQPGEFFVFQVAVYAARSDLGQLAFSSSGFPGAVRCISLGGIGPDGKPFSKHITVARRSC